MPTPIQTDLASVLSAIKAKLVSDSVFTPSAVYLGLNPEAWKNPNASQFGVIVPGKQDVRQEEVYGGGNDALFLRGEVQVWLWSRLSTDELTRDENFLTDPTLGSLATVRQVIKSLQCQQLLDPVSGNSLTVEPLFMLGMDQGKRKVGDPTGWGGIVTRWEVNWWFSFA